MISQSISSFIGRLMYLKHEFWEQKLSDRLHIIKGAIAKRGMMKFTIQSSGN
ncbi:hypothetical protein [Anabaena sp. CCY 9910]|uniref:hypothetical protein n=1 Tax=Anabaena sp. CCY 9910 TaxID=3103870 RepID=UPI0039E07AC6